MNLEELVGEDGLQQDEYSLSRPKFGREGQIEVIGWSGKDKWCTKLYIIKCKRCANDVALFGAGCFRSQRSNLVSGQLPCGCGGSPHWSEEQYTILCSRKAKELGYTFLGFEGREVTPRTKIKMLCKDHGEWFSGSIAGLINQGNGCPGCRVDTVAEAKKKPDEIMIASFFASGCFHPDTKFWRSDRKNTSGYKVYWYMDCPECGERGDTQSIHLQAGHRPCRCSLHRQQECYINWVVDEYNNAVGVKFGIANNSSTRIQSQNRQSLYEVRQYQVYKFPTVELCKTAERECKQTLECGILTKQEMPDGWTETTDVLNLVKIKQIYLKHGGVLT